MKKISDELVMHWSGIWNNNIQSNIIVNVIDNQVFLDFNMIMVEATKSGSIVCNEVLPDYLLPKTNKYFIVVTINNNIQNITPMQISKEGKIVFYGQNNFGDFNGSGFAGFYNNSVRYTV